ncbi:MAG TPA: fructosamine kinase family protein [Burkholderiaceae bacterium]|nr:fructosamine kinase family protein [Burkholderiaceae bacterium]
MPLGTVQIAAIDAVLARAAGARARITAVLPLAGGSIAAAYRLDTTVGPCFLKLGAAAHPFDAEADALREIAATATVRVPRPLESGVVGAAGFLLLEWIDLRPSGDWRAAGESLAALHAVVREQYGWTRDNAIGATEQFNAPCPGASWSEFYLARRLEPQLKLAARRGLRAIAERADAARSASRSRLAGHEPPPSLLHGDLWRGNLGFDDAGRAVLFDPALYYGDPETDIAMTWLFGGFDPRFHAAYEAMRPTASGAERRRPVYQLYHVLNHAHLFGGGYIDQARELIDRIASE